jgi:DinB superfamily
MTSLSQSSRVVSSASSRTAIDTLVWLSDDAFAGYPAHSLLANLRDLPAEDWTALPPGGSRSIADILEHVAWSKWMYDDAFSAASLRGDQPPLSGCAARLMPRPFG